MTESGIAALLHVHDEAERFVAAIQSSHLGSTQASELLAISLVSRCHMIVEGQPGVGKTTLVKAACRIAGLTLGRIQGTNEIWPSDITGSAMWLNSSESFRFIEGPVFNDVVLFDELNRVPPRSQSALLEAMAESSVTVGGQTNDLPLGFVVIATANLLGESAFRLELALADRFSCSAEVPPLSTAQELELLLRGSRDVGSPSPISLEILREAVSNTEATEQVLRYALDLVSHVRALARPHLLSTRVVLDLVTLSKGRSVLMGRDYITPEDIKFLLIPAIRHRIPEEIGLAAGSEALQSVRVPR